MISKLIELPLPSHFRKAAQKYSSESLADGTDVGLVPSPCSRYVAWWCRDLLAVYEGPDVVMQRKGIDPAFLLWSHDSKKVLIGCKKVSSEGSLLLPIILLDTQTGNTLVEYAVDVSSFIAASLMIVGCFWFGSDRQVCLVVSNATILLLSINLSSSSSIFIQDGVSFGKSYVSLSSCLTESGNIVLFGTSKHGSSMATKWKLSSKFPHFQSLEMMTSSSVVNASPERASPLGRSGILSKLWSLVFGKQTNSLNVANDAVTKNCRFKDCFLALSFDGLLLGCFSFDGKLRWTRETRKRYGLLENSDLITDISSWNQESFLLSTSSGRLIRDNLNVREDATEPFTFPFTFKTIYLITSITNDRIYIHDYFLKAFIQCDPEEMLKSFIVHHQYDEGYGLALRFHLNTDTVLKAKWRDSVNLNNWDTSILEQVDDKKWVLEVCMSSFPNSSATIKKLLNFGVSLTNHISPSLVEEELEKMHDKLESCSSPSKTTSKELSVVDLYLYRIQLLRTLDALCTFELLFNEEIATIESVGNLFASFLKEGLLGFAIKQAEFGKVECLETLFTRHGPTLLPYRLALLDRLPLTLSPSRMEKVLPSPLKSWREIPWRRSDWSESKDLLEFVALLQDDEEESLIEPVDYPEAENLTKTWYSNRIERLVSDIGQVPYARALCDLAVNNGVALDKEALNLGLLECAKKSAEFESLTLSGLKQLSPITIQNLILAACDSSTAAHVTSHILYPFIQSQKQSVEFDAISKELKKGLLSLCFRDSACLKSFAMACQNNPQIIDFLSIPFLISECAYGSKSSAPLQFWTELIDGLKSTSNLSENAENSGGWGDVDFDIEMEDSSLESALGVDTKNELGKFVARLSQHVSLALFVKKHGLDWSLSQIKSLESDDSKAALSKILRQSKLLPTASDQIWDETLLSLLGFIQQGLFSQVSDIVLYTEIVVLCLSLSKFQFVQSRIFFPKSGTCPLSQSTVELLVLNAATEFYDNDQQGDQANGLMKLSRTCCTLLKPNIKAIKEHLDLIEATHSLVFVHHIKYDAYTSIMPIQVRLHKDRVMLLRNLLEKKPELYKNRDLLFSLSSQLVGVERASSTRSQHLIHLFMGQAALRSESYEDALAILLSLIDKNFDPRSLNDTESALVWKTIEQLALSPFRNTKGKLALLSVAATKCDASHVSSLLVAWRQLLVSSEMDEYQPLGGKTLSAAHFILKEEEKRFLNADIEDIGSPNSVSQNCHDFYQPVGSPLHDESSYSIQKHSTGLKMIANGSTLFYLESLFFQLDQDTIPFPISLCPNLLRHDIPSTLSLLLISRATNDELILLFESLTPDSFHYSLAAYFFSLKAALLLPLEVLGQEPFSVSFHQLPRLVSSTAAQQAHSELKNRGAILELVSCANSFLEKTKSSKASQLRAFLVTVIDADPQLVETDENYREEKILELVKTNVWKTVATAVALAEQEGISSSKIWSAHALWLFSRDNNLPDINYEDSKAALLANFIDIEPHLQFLHSQALSLDSCRLSKFYSILLDAYATKKLKPNPDDVSQLSIRQNILADLQKRGIHSQLSLSDVLDAQRCGIEGYFSIWVEMGQYIGLESFCSSLNIWMKLSPLLCVKESLQNSLSKSHQEKLKSEVICKCVFHYVASQPWESLDLFSTNSILEDVFQTFSSMLPHQVEELAVSLLSGNHFDVQTKSLILSHSIPFAEHSTRLDQQRELLELVTRLYTLTDKFGSRLPSTITDFVASCYVEKPELLKNGLVDFCTQNVSPELIAAVCVNVSLDALALYNTALDRVLEEENSDLVEQCVMILSKFGEEEVAEEKNETKIDPDGWDIDDNDLFVEDEDSFVTKLRALYHEKLEGYSLGDKASDSFKVKLLHFLEKYFVVNGRNTSHLQDAKLSSSVQLHWGIKLETERSLAVFLPPIIERTESAMQSLYLLELLRDWPEVVQEEHWMMAFIAITKLGYVDLLLACRAFFRLSTDIISLKVEMGVLDLLSQSTTSSNHYFLYCLLSSRPEIQNIGLAEFEKVHANGNSYQVTYRVASCLGFLPRLSVAHQEACIQSVLVARDQDSLSLPLLGIILADFPGSTHPICRAWLGIGKGLVKGYRRWVGLEGRILKEAMDSWDSSISAAIYSYLQPRDSICPSVAAGHLDRNQLFTLLVVDAMNVHAKNRLFCMEESHYALRHLIER